MDIRGKIDTFVPRKYPIMLCCLPEFLLVFHVYMCLCAKVNKGDQMLDNWLFEYYNSMTIVSYNIFCAYLRLHIMPSTWQLKATKLTKS